MREPCDHFEPLLDIMAAGGHEDLHPQELAAAQEHVAECDSCRARLDFSKGLMAEWASDLRSEPGPSHRAELLVRVMEKIESRPWWRAAWDMVGARTLIPVASVLTATLIAVLISTGGPPKAPAAPGIIPEELASLAEMDVRGAIASPGLTDDATMETMESALIEELAEDIPTDATIYQTSTSLLSPLDDLSEEQTRELLTVLDSYMPAGT